MRRAIQTATARLKVKESNPEEKKVFSNTEREEKESRFCDKKVPHGRCPRVKYDGIEGRSRGKWASFPEVKSKKRVPDEMS